MSVICMVLKQAFLSIIRTKQSVSTNEQQRKPPMMRRLEERKVIAYMTTESSCILELAAVFL